MWKMKSLSTEVFCRLVPRLEIESTSIHETLITGLLFTELRLPLPTKGQSLRLVNIIQKRRTQLGNSIKPQLVIVLANFLTQECNFI